MKYTSSEAAKLLRTLNGEYDALRYKEGQTCEFVAAVGEDIETVRPEYDYPGMQRKLKRLEEQIRAVKHEINRFNLNTVVPGFDMTIDQMLIYIPQLTARKRKLYAMMNRLPKQRERAAGSGKNYLIEYSYANYDISAAGEDYRRTSAELVRAQTALDLVNNTETMEISGIDIKELEEEFA